MPSLANSRALWPSQLRHRDRLQAAAAPDGSGSGGGGSSSATADDLMAMPMSALKELAAARGVPGKQRRTIVAQLLALDAEPLQQRSADGADAAAAAPEGPAATEWVTGSIDLGLGGDWDADGDGDDAYDDDDGADGDDAGGDEFWEGSAGAAAQEQRRGVHTRAGKKADDMDARLKAASQDRSFGVAARGGRGGGVAELDFSKYGFDSDEKLDLTNYRVDPRAGCCPGCGVQFQPKDPGAPGFLPLEKLEELLAQRAADLERRQAESGYVEIEKMATEVQPFDFEEEEARLAAEDEEAAKRKQTVCQRCHKLRYFGQVDDALRPGVSTHELLTPARFQELLSVLRTTPCLVVYLVDLFDFHGSFLYNLPNIVGHNPVIIAANKVDLLPKDMARDRVRGWVKDECRLRGLRELEMKDVHLISCKTGSGVPSLMKKARERAMELGVDMYVVGAANVGKSSFINHLLQDRSVVKRNAERNKLLSQGLTVSIVPGTTLDFLRVNMGGDVCLYDTPGLILPHQLTSRLTPEELKSVIPAKAVEHVTLRLTEGKAVLVGGLARIELVSGKPFLFTFFVSNEVKLHMTDAARVDEFIDKHMGSKLLFPPFSKERYQELGPMVSSEFTVVGEGWRRAGPDIVLSGLGWISVTGAGECAVKVTAPKDILVLTRDPLMPFEAWDTTSTFTGTRTVKRGKKTQGRRV